MLCAPINTYIGVLHVKVNPEVGMRSAAGEQALKLWFDKPEMTRRVSEIFHYLLQRATTEPSWPRGWHLNVLDVRRETVLLHPPIPDGFEDEVIQAATEWLAE